ncbi:MAG: hypothetical protein JO036_15755 [Candidatus Eremiobacteraeota bacterium]|nr:hypothetical protein [Candidatus Eremiobacteraeota bacterium]
MPKVLLTQNGARQFCFVDADGGALIEAALSENRASVTVQVATPNGPPRKLTLNTAHIVGVEYED